MERSECERETESGGIIHAEFATRTQLRQAEKVLFCERPGEDDFLAQGDNCTSFKSIFRPLECSRHELLYANNDLILIDHLVGCYVNTTLLRPKLF